MPSAEELEGYARDCVRLAGSVDDPLVREKLLEMARDWMSAAMELEAGASPGSSPPRRRGRLVA